MFIYYCINVYKKAPRYSFIKEDKFIEPVKDDYFVTGGRVDPIFRKDAINENNFGIGYTAMNHPLK